MNRLYTAILFMMLGPGLFAQQPSFTTDVDTNHILIGEQVQLTLEARLPANSNFVWPVISDSIPGLEVVKASEVDTSREDDFWLLTQNIRLTSFDSGYTAIPPLDLRAGTKTYTSSAIGLRVSLPEMAEGEELYDIKGPREAPFNWQRFLSLAALGLFLAGVIFAIIYFLRKRKKEPAPEPEHRLPPYEFALMQLHELEKEQLWQNGKIKEYYSRLTDILRLYLEREKAIPAMESTADEVNGMIDQMHLPKQLKRETKELMSLSAMVKFAKEKPGAGTNERAVETLRRFLEETKPVKEKDAELPV